MGICSSKQVEYKPADFIGRPAFTQNCWFAHCSSIPPTTVAQTGLQLGKAERLNNGNSVKLLYAIALDPAHNDLSHAPRLSSAQGRTQWAEQGNYAYVFNARGKECMSAGTVWHSTEVGFRADVAYEELYVFRIGTQRALLTTPYGIQPPAPAAANSD